MTQAKIRSWHALAIYLIVMCGGYVLAAYVPDAPFTTFSTQITIGLGLYLSKRVVQKHKNFNGGKKID